MSASWSTRLISELTQLDERECQAETRRRLRPNIYRLGIYLGAAHEVIDAVNAGTEPAEAFSDAFTPTRGMHTVARRLNLKLTVERGQWVQP